MIVCFYQGEYTPKQATEDASGYDLIAQHDIAPSREPVKVRTGLKLSAHIASDLEDLGFALDIQIRPRSSTTKYGYTAETYGYTVELGTIDNDYRGEILIKLLPVGNEQEFIPAGTRLAQLVFGLRAVDVHFIQTEQLGSTERGEGGFGSTGV